MDAAQFRKAGHELIDFIADYYERVGTYPVMSAVEPGYLAKLLPDGFPQEPEPFEAIRKDFEEKIMPGVTHWQSPNFFAFFPCNASFPAMLGDMLSGMINCAGFNWICSPACTELETIVLDWMARLLELPQQFMSSGKGGGVIQGTASEAVIVVMVAARALAIKNRPEGMDAATASGNLVAYASAQAHSASKKAAMVANVRFREVPTNADFTMDVAQLEAMVAADRAAGLIPFWVCATVGTTGCGAVDDVTSVGVFAQREKIWVHVDAAWAGSAAVCPEYRHLLKGLEHVDSYNFNAHKWLLTNFDCSLLWVKERSHLIDALSVTPSYLRNAASESGLVTDYRDWQLPLGRRFRSLKLWFVVRAYGVSGLQAHVRKHIAQAELFESLVKSDARFQLACPRSLALVCFYLRPAQGQDAAKLNQRLEDFVHARGIFVSHTVLNNRNVIRFVPGSPWTEDEHIRSAWALFQNAADELLTLGAL